MLLSRVLICMMSDIMLSDFILNVCLSVSILSVIKPKFVMLGITVLIFVKLNVDMLAEN